ncbi:MAG: hypothetical protein HAW66_05925 [Shewanella sp.]|nr:hypothetical protein [Shewanella sp.]
MKAFKKLHTTALESSPLINKNVTSSAKKFCVNSLSYSVSATLGGIAGAAIGATISIFFGSQQESDTTTFNEGYVSSLPFTLSIFGAAGSAAGLATHLFIIKSLCGTFNVIRACSQRNEE